MRATFKHWMPSTRQTQENAKLSLISSFPSSRAALVSPRSYAPLIMVRLI